MQQQNNQFATQVQQPGQQNNPFDDSQASEPSVHRQGAPPSQGQRKPKDPFDSGSEFEGKSSDFFPNSRPDQPGNNPFDSGR